MIDELQSDYIYSEIFRAFDIEDKGFITHKELNIAANAAGWNSDRISSLVTELDPEHKGEFNLEELILILKFIEQKNAPEQKTEAEKTSKEQIFLPSVKNNTRSPSTNTASMSKRLQDSIFSSAEPSIYELDKKKYGALLPKTGVYFLPDERIIMFLK